MFYEHRMQGMRTLVYIIISIVLFSCNTGVNKKTSDKAEEHEIEIDGVKLWYMDMCSTANFKSIKKINKVINRELVLNTLIYTLDAKFKTGDKIHYDQIGATFLFKKTNNKWMVIYFHESGNPPS